MASRAGSAGGRSGTGSSGRSSSGRSARSPASTAARPTETRLANQVATATRLKLAAQRPSSGLAGGFGGGVPPTPPPQAQKPVLAVSGLTAKAPKSVSPDAQWKEAAATNRRRQGQAKRYEAVDKALERAEAEQKAAGRAANRAAQPARPGSFDGQEILDQAGRLIGHWRMRGGQLVPVMLRKDSGPGGPSV